MSGSEWISEAFLWVVELVSGRVGISVPFQWVVELVLKSARISPSTISVGRARVGKCGDLCTIPVDGRIYDAHAIACANAYPSTAADMADLTFHRLGVSIWASPAVFGQ